MAAKNIVIDIISDAICPWCFVGKRRLEKAISACKDTGATFTIRWHPFFLDPGLPEAGVDKMTRYKEKFGEARMAQMLPYMQQVGLKDGIKFSYGGKIAATLNAHRLAEFAYERGGAALQNAVIEELFHFYFEREGNVGDVAALIDIGAAAGLPREELERFLHSDAKKAEVIAEARTLQLKHRVTGVPFFIINDTYKLSGAQDPGSFVEVFNEVVEGSS